MTLRAFSLMVLEPHLHMKTDITGGAIKNPYKSKGQVFSASWLAETIRIAEMMDARTVGVFNQATRNFMGSVSRIRCSLKTSKHLSQFVN